LVLENELKRLGKNQIDYLIKKTLHLLLNTDNLNHVPIYRDRSSVTTYDLRCDHYFILPYAIPRQSHLLQSIPGRYRNDQRKRVTPVVIETLLSYIQLVRLNVIEYIDSNETIIIKEL
jgi:hypothetical protein